MGRLLQLTVVLLAILQSVIHGSPAPTLTIYETLQTLPLTTFTGLVEQTGVDEALNDTNRFFTTFASTNFGFDDVRLSCFQRSYNSALLRTLIRGHIVENAIIKAVDIQGISLTLATLADGDTIRAQGVNGGIRVFSKPPVVSETSTTDILATNGVIQVIEPAIIAKSLPPMSFTALFLEENFTAFEELVRLTSQGSLAMACTRRGRSVYVPTNEAIDNLVASFNIQLGPNETSAQALVRVFGVEAMRTIVQYHFLDFRIRQKRMENKAASGEKSITTVLLRPQKLKYQGSGSDLDVLFGKHFSHCSRVLRNVTALNGFAHVVDTVLVPAIVDLDFLFNNTLP